MLHIKSNILQLIHLQIQVQADSKLVQIGPIYCKNRQNNRPQRTELRLLKLAKNRQSLKKHPLLVGHKSLYYLDSKPFSTFFTK